MQVALFFGLLVCNVIWSLNPTMGKIVLRDFDPAHLAWFRMLTAYIAYLLFASLMQIRKESKLENYFAVPQRLDVGVLLFILGFLAFSMSPILLTAGLDASLASDNAVIVALEPLATVFIARLILGEMLNPKHYLSFLLAFVGVSLLSNIHQIKFDNLFSPHLIGNILIVGSLLGEAAYSTIARKLLPHHDAKAIFSSSLLVGICLTGLFVFYFTKPIPFENINTNNLLAILWLGPLSTAFCYSFWLYALSHSIPIASMAITLFIQPILGLVWGYVLLGERLGIIQAVGILVILVAVGIQMDRKKYAENR